VKSLIIKMVSFGLLALTVAPLAYILVEGWIRAMLSDGIIRANVNFYGEGWFEVGLISVICLLDFIWIIYLLVNAIKSAYKEGK